MWEEYCYAGADLGTVVFYRKVTNYEPSYYYLDITARYGRPAWAILTVSVEYFFFLDFILL